MTIKEMLELTGDDPFIFMPFASIEGAKEGKKDLIGDGWLCHIVNPKEGENDVNPETSARP